jgi:hypothetical protein
MDPTPRNRRLKVLLNTADEPKFVCEPGPDGDAMNVIVRGGDQIEWTSTGNKNFTIEFQNPPGSPFEGGVLLLDSGGNPPKVVGTIVAGAPEVLYKYSVLGPPPNKAKLDPQIIIDR